MPYLNEIEVIPATDEEVEDAVVLCESGPNIWVPRLGNEDTPTALHLSWEEWVQMAHSILAFDIQRKVEAA